MMSTTASILVIDDEEIMREILETLLSREGYSVRLATSAEEGLELARSMPRSSTSCCRAWTASPRSRS